MITNLVPFLTELKKSADRLGPEHLVPFVKKVSLQMLNYTVKATPVDTGRARGNWQLTVGAPALDALELTDRSGSGVYERGLAQLVSLQPFQNVWLSNNLPYIERLENGWSDQAPNGMVGPSLALIEAQFNNG